MQALRFLIMFCGLLVLLITTYCSATELPTFAWDYVLRSPRDDSGRCITGDEMGNVFVAGVTEGNIDTETNTTGSIFLAKFSSQGDVLWKKQFGPVQGIEVNAIATDKSGNCYLVGRTSGSINEINPMGSYDAYIVKHSPEGNLLWARLLGTTSNDIVNAIAVDENSNCYIAGKTGGNLDSESSSYRGSSSFIAKYDKDGSLLWVEQLRLGNAREGNVVSIQSDGTIYTAGKPGYIASYDPNGVLLNSITASLTDFYGATFDSKGNLYTSGWDASITGFVEKYDPSGTRLWRRNFRDTGWTAPKYVVMCTDGSGDVLTGGCQQGPGGANDCQAFFRCFDPNGVQTFRYDYMGGNSCGVRVGVDSAGACLLTGNRSSVDAHVLKLDYSPYVQTNLATGKTIECSQEQSDHPAEFATDIDLHTYWQAEGFPQYLEIDLGGIYDVNETQMISKDSRIYQYKIETRKDVNEQYDITVDKTDSNVPCSISSPLVDTFEPTEARYIRLTIIGQADEKGDDVSIREFGVFASP